jgi:hypothetical protein
MFDPLYEDPVVAEIHAIRAKMLEECGGDHQKLMQRVYEHQRTSGRRIIPAPDLPARKDGGFLPIGRPTEK